MREREGLRSFREFRAFAGRRRHQQELRDEAVCNIQEIISRSAAPL
jgi:hypothetical protein